jgi:hypothetical protein
MHTYTCGEHMKQRYTQQQQDTRQHMHRVIYIKHNVPAGNVT